MEKEINKKFKNEDPDVVAFISESNLIERVPGDEAIEDSLKAWKYLMQRDFIGIKDVLRVHELALKRVDPRIAGRFRECDVWIGGQHKKFITKRILRDRVREVVGKMNAAIDGFIKEEDRKKTTPKQHHVLFEDIHPFEDGNGRVGRLLYNWQRVKMGYDIHVIHTGSEQQDYYQWFRDKSLWR